MSDTAMFVGWGGTYPGREEHALKHDAEFVEILTKLKADGEIESFQTVLLTPHGGDLDGFTLIFAAPEKLAALQMREDLHRLQTSAKMDHARFGVIPAITGDLVEREFALFGEALSEYHRDVALV